MTTKTKTSLTEAGRAVSAANVAKINAAIAELQALLPKPEDAEGENAEPLTEAAPFKVQTIEEVRAGLQKLMDLLPPESREQIEGDGDGDGDPVNAILATAVGGPLLPMDEAAKSKVEPDADEKGGASDSDTDDHMDVFGNMTPAAKATHLLKVHGATKADAAVPARQAAMHKAAHTVKEAVSDIELTSEFIRLTEKAIGNDGTLQVKVLEPGWGSSGHYEQKILERDGAAAWPAGTKMYWNHPSKSEERDRPERDLRDLAAVTTTDPVYLQEGPEGPGLYAIAKPVSGYKDAIEELAPYIGVSIRAAGKGHKGERDGKIGSIVEAILPARKGGIPNGIDFVTEPGAGGKIMQLFESVGRRSNNEDKDTEDDVEVTQELKETKVRLNEATDENKRLRERILLRDAHDLAETELGKVEGMPAPSIRRLAESLSRDPPTDDDGDLDQKSFRTKIKEAVKSEAAYLESVMRTGRPRGLGTSNDDNSADDDAEVGGLSFSRSLETSFTRLGLPKNLAESAAKGR